MIAAQHDAGKLTARARIDLLLDPGSFVESARYVTHRCTDFGLAAHRPPGDGVITGYGTIDGRTVCVFAQDPTVLGGSLGAAHAAKICALFDLARKVGAPVVGLHDSEGLRLEEGLGGLAGQAAVLVGHTLARGVVPQVSAILGPCVGGAALAPGLADFVFMVSATSHLYVTGPEVVRAVTDEAVTDDELGGPEVHAAGSGVAHFTAPDDRTCLADIRRLLSFLPSHGGEDPPRGPRVPGSTGEVVALDGVAPARGGGGYSMQGLVALVVDDGDLFEVGPDFAPNLRCAFARVDGRPVGVVANEPGVLAGCLDRAACDKAARFVGFCDRFRIPVVTFVDTPGFLPGTDQEHGGIVRDGARLLRAFAEATVPRVTVIVRRAYGAAWAVMASKPLGADLTLAWPGAEIGAMGPEGAVAILHGREIAASSDPAGARAALAEQYRAQHTSPQRAAELGMVDDVIAPRETRRRVAGALALLQGRRVG